MISKQTHSGLYSCFSNITEEPINEKSGSFWISLFGEQTIGKSVKFWQSLVIRSVQAKENYSLFSYFVQGIYIKNICIFNVQQSWNCALHSECQK